MTAVQRSRLSSEDREDILDEEVARQLAPGFMLPHVRVESRTAHQAVLVYGHNPNHVVHALLSIVTLGAWLLVWLVVAANQREERMTLQVDRYGIVTRD
jgi:hypothetical protein